MIIVMRGLPASGKSTIAARLADALPATILNKDRVRAAIFVPADVDYSAEQDDLCMDVIFRTAAYLLRRDPGRKIIIDGRTFSRRSQLDAVKTAAAMAETPLLIVECLVDRAAAHERLRHDAAHEAANRDAALFDRIAAVWEPIDDPRLVLDTARLSLDECTARALRYIQSEPTPS